MVGASKFTAHKGMSILKLIFFLCKQLLKEVANKKGEGLGRWPRLQYVSDLGDNSLSKV
jgi:hypothetical protein